MKDIPPIAFIFMGSFLSNSYGSEVMDLLKKLFKKLADLVLQFPSLSENSRFVFIPSLTDPCTPHVIPR